MSYRLRCGCELEEGSWLIATCKHGRDFGQALRGIEEVTQRPKVVCLCGSTRFSEVFQKVNLLETLAGRIVLTIGCDMRSDDDLFSDMSPKEITEVKSKLDVLHFRKIDMADEAIILNVGGYIGESTRRELDYARAMGKTVRFLEPEAVK